MKRLIPIVLIVLSLSAVGAVTETEGDCQRSGYDWCYYYQYGDARAEIAMNVYDPPNDVRWTQYHGRSWPYVLLSDGGYEVTYWCSGTTYFKSTSCNEDGCDGQNLGSSGRKVLKNKLATEVFMDNFRCFKRTPDYWSWAQFDAFYPHYLDGEDRRVMILNCGNNDECAYDEFCDMSSNNPIDWDCEPVECDTSVCKEWETAETKMQEHECKVTCKLRPGFCESNGDCEGYEYCEGHVCKTLVCDDGDPCTIDTADNHQCFYEPDYTGQCSPCYGLNIDDNDWCTDDKCTVVNGEAVITHEPIEGFCLQVWMIAVIVVCILLIVGVVLYIRGKRK